MLVMLAEILGYVIGIAARVAGLTALDAWLRNQFQNGDIAYIKSQSDFIAQRVPGVGWFADADLKFAAILSALDGVDTQAVLDAIAALPAGSSLPPVGTQDPLAVWSYQNDYRDTVGNMLAKLDQTNYQLGPRAAYPAPAAPWFGLFYPTNFGD